MWDIFLNKYVYCMYTEPDGRVGKLCGSQQYRVNYRSSVIELSQSAVNLPLWVRITSIYIPL
jgi:hypothetical protein